MAREAIRGETVVPEIVGTILFLAAIGLTGAKFNRLFGEYGLLGYVALLAVTIVYAAAIAIAFA